MNTTTDKTRENRLRRLADRQDLRLIKSRRRDVRAVDFGVYWLADTHTNGIVTASNGIDLDDVDAYLTTDPVDNEASRDRRADGGSS